MHTKIRTGMAGGFIIAITGALLFSTKAIFVKLAFQHTQVSAIHLLVLRMLFSLPFYLIAATYARKTSTEKLTRKQWVLLALMGILGYYLSSLFDFMGLQFVSAGLERLILFLYPTFTVLINTFYFKTKLKRTQVAALLLTYIGIGIAFLGEVKLDAGNIHFFLGTFMIFLCAVTYSIYLAGTGKLVPIIGSTKYTAYVMLFATMGVFTHFLITNHQNFGQLLQPNLLIYGIALAIIATVLPSFLMNISMNKIGSNNVAIITSIGPVSTIIQAHFFLDEPIFFLQLAGTALVIVGILLIGWKPS
ncbi:MAG: DMT family transporter [Sphingobacteriales bacterium]|uniref:DMT family transporter n=1 Tax=Hydrotalea flava TaxID=714549 RepID=UPI000FB3F567|nr:DMT family transporter [Hydrotalea flava]RTL52037.1 MAG: DMT family transporter [Sphingobacteriales bacterium]